MAERMEKRWRKRRFTSVRAYLRVYDVWYLCQKQIEYCDCGKVWKYEVAGEGTCNGKQESAEGQRGRTKNLLWDSEGVLVEKQHISSIGITTSWLHLERQKIKEEPRHKKKKHLNRFCVDRRGYTVFSKIYFDYCFNLLRKKGGKKWIFKKVIYYLTSCRGMWPTILLFLGINFVFLVIFFIVFFVQIRLPTSVISRNDKAPSNSLIKCTIFATIYAWKKFSRVFRNNIGLREQFHGNNLSQICKKNIRDFNFQVPSRYVTVNKKSYLDGWNRVSTMKVC